MSIISKELKEVLEEELGESLEDFEQAANYKDADDQDEDDDSISEHVYVPTIDPTKAVFESSTEIDHNVSDVELEKFDPLEETSDKIVDDVIDLPTTASTGAQGIIDQKKQLQVLQKQQTATMNGLFIKWFERYLNSVYKAFYTVNGNVTIKQGEQGGFINLDSNDIVLYDKLIIDLWNSGVPPLLVFYHEIGHLLFTTTDAWNILKSLTPDIAILLNWLEDFYIEDRLMKELYYIKPYIKMLHEVVPDFIDDWQKPHFAFNYYYAFEGQVPMWMSQTTPPIDKTFVNHINTLLNLRKNISSKFAQQRFINELQNFFMFCVQHKILNQQTPPPPTQPQPQQKQGNGSGSGNGSNNGANSGTGRGKGGNGNVSDLDFSADPNSTPSNPMGTVPDVNALDPNHVTDPVHTVFKPLDPVKGFDNTLKDLMSLLSSEFDKQMYDAFMPANKGKLELVPRTRNTTSPRSMIDPIAIVTNQSAIYLEYITEEVNYVGYNIFIDASGSVGFNLDYNKGIEHVINIIKQYPHNVYSYNDTLIKWGPEEIKNVLKLQGDGGTESALVAPIILEKREEKNLNIIFSDGDLSVLFGMKDFDMVKDKYLFVFVCVGDPAYYEQKLSNKLDPKQFFCYEKASEIDVGLQKLKEYIKNKGA